MASTGQGSVSINPKAKASGAPFPITSADNGLSVDAITGRIVFGNDQTFTQGGTAKLLNNREIDLAGHSLNFIDDPGTGLQQAQLSTGVFSLLDTVSGNLASLQIGSTLASLILNSQPPGSALINFNNSTIYNLENDGTSLFVRDSITNQFLLIDMITDSYAIGDISNRTTGTNMRISASSGNFDFGIAGTGDRTAQFIAFNHIAQFGDLDSVAAGLIAKVDSISQTFDLRNTAMTSVYACNGQQGFTGTVTPVVSITVEGGIVTSVT